MDLNEILEDIKKICQTCDECDPSCAGHTVRECIKSEVENESLLQLL